MRGSFAFGVNHYKVSTSLSCVYTYLGLFGKTQRGPRNVLEREEEESERARAGRGG